MRPIHTVFAALFAAAAFSCISVPRQTVRLAETMQEQTASLQSVHEALIASYYNELRYRVDTFLMQQWIPTFLAKAVNNPVLEQRSAAAMAAGSLSSKSILEKVGSVSTLSTAEKSAIGEALSRIAVGGQAQMGGVMIDFGEAAMKEIDKKRQELFAPIDEQEQLVLSKVRAAYANLQSEQAAIKAFLSSSANVQIEETAVAQKLHLLSARNDVIQMATTASADTAEVLTDAGAADAFVANMKRTNEQLKSAAPAAPAPGGKP